MVLAFAGIFRVPINELPSYAHYVLSGVVFTTFICSGLTGVTTSISYNRGVISKVKVWKFSYPLSVLCAQLINFMFGSMLAFIAGAFAGKFPNGIFLLSIIGISFQIFGLGLILSVFQSRFEDVGNILPIVLQLLMYITPVFYREDLVPIRFLWVLNLNPFVHMLRIFRFGVGSTDNVPVISILGSIGFGVIFFTVGIWTFSKNWKKTVTYL